MTTLRIANGRVIDPAQNLDRVADPWLADVRLLGAGPHPAAGLWPEARRVPGVGPQPARAAARPLDAAGQIVSPGWIDMPVHLREPGREEDEPIPAAPAAAVAGGVTSVACMPNTEPALD